MNILNIPHGRGIRIVQAGEIVRIQGMSNYSKIYLVNDAPLVVAKVLHWFERSLSRENFIRIHKSHLVNRNYVKAVAGIRSRSIVLYNGEVIMVSRRNKSKLSA